MAAKRIAQSTFNWAALAERVPEHQRAQYLAFKSKSDTYNRKMTANPENPPQIDWKYYENTVPVAGLVQEFKQKYEAITIPVPSVDAHYAAIDSAAKETQKSIDEFKAESNQRITDFQADLARVKAMIPYHMMTLEEVYQYAPELGVDRKDPGFYPIFIDDKEIAPAPHH